MAKKKAKRIIVAKTRRELLLQQIERFEDLSAPAEVALIQRCPNTGNVVAKARLPVGYCLADGTPSVDATDIDWKPA